RLDFHSAVRQLEEFERVWPEAKLTWEPELVRAESRMAAKPLDLDSGYEAWKKLEARLNALEGPRSWTVLLRRNFFSRLLAANRKLFEEPRTAAGGRSETFISWPSSRGMRGGVMKTRSGGSAMAGGSGFNSATAISGSYMDLWPIPITTGRSCWD